MVKCYIRQIKKINIKKNQYVIKNERTTSLLQINNISLKRFDLIFNANILN